MFRFRACDGERHLFAVASRKSLGVYHGIGAFIRTDLYTTAPKVKAQP